MFYACSTPFVVWTPAVGFCAWPQTQGSITGLVTDRTGGLIIGAIVTLSNPQTGLTRQVATNSAGAYGFPALLPGLYNVKVEMQGFQAEIRNSIELQVEQVARIDFQLQVGAVGETVEVAAGAPLLNTEDAALGTVIENRRIVELPLNGRNYPAVGRAEPERQRGLRRRTSTSRQGGTRANSRSRSAASAANSTTTRWTASTTPTSTSTPTSSCLDRRAGGIQSADWRLLGRIRTRSGPGERRHQGGHE